MSLGTIMDLLPYLFIGFAFIVGVIWLSVMKFGKSARDRETVRFELVLAESARLLKALQNNPKSIGYDRVRSLLREVQMRLHELPPEVMSRYENRVMKVLQEAARLGITVSPESTLQHR